MRNLSFQKKLFIQYSIVVFVIIALSVFVFYRYIVKTTEEEAMKNLKQLTAQASQQVDTFLQGMDHTALQVMGNPRIVEVMEQAQESYSSGNYFNMNSRVAFEVGRNLTAILGPKVSASRISVYNLQGDYVSMGTLEETPSDIERFLHGKEIVTLYDKVTARKGKELILEPHPDFWSDEKDRSVISVFRMIKDIGTGKAYGIVEVQQSYSMLKDHLDFPNLSNVQAYLFSEEGKAIATATDEPGVLSNANLYFSPTEAGILQHRMVNVHGKQEVVILTKSAFSGYTLALVQTRDDLFITKDATVKILFFSALSLILLTALVLYLLSQSLTKPLKQLRVSLNNVSLNRLSIELDQPKQVNEFILLNRAFEAMFRRLNESVSQEIKAHLLAMQSQMNPHFLYNMLAVISASAVESGNDAISTMCYKLSKMLRYVSTLDEQEVTLEDEMTHTHNYLDLMKDRYEEGLEYDIQAVGNQLSSVRIPKLILQPLVENCFQHAFNTVESPWFIGIIVKAEENGWSITVSDRGTGFDEGALANLEKKIADAIVNSNSLNINGWRIGGLGLVNTIVRLKMLYRGDFYYRIEKNGSTGTRVTIGVATR
ncbi:sensor histidine kinase [Cohnella abietis]|uniref:HAMP domain-containing protein n=1 Tax=Cohnella abietis TaxID=2507935 RepID=A0A3T1DBQ9_9BACL|nr:histidine kinase [Cohnella abietis]BBI35529.1 hypothetical protein KCTCHS21_49280 [Cohnella abietis]